jgi:chorismate mutase
MDDLANLRNEIDRLDESLIEILAQRFRITHEIGQLKKATNLPPVDAQREERQAQRIKDIANKLGLREAVALKVLRVIIDEVVNDHKKI